MKVIYKILLVLALSIGTVAALYCMQEKPKKNGFNRGLVYTVEKLDSLELKYNYWYFAGLSDNRIYIGNYKAALALFSCGYNLQDSVYERLLYVDESKRKLEVLKKLILQKISPLGDNFSTDGFVSSNAAGGRMVYTHYYNNSFVCLDSALNVLYTAQTIDTNTVAKITIGEYKSEGKRIRTLTKPAAGVNKRGYSNGDYFYNHAALPADNEKLSDFNKHEVLDVYLLDNGRYSYSIYLPKYKGEKLTDFVVRDEMIIALYGRYLITYRR